MIQLGKSDVRSINPEMTVAELLIWRPGAVVALTRRKMACPVCGMAGFETLAEVAQIYQIPVEDLIQEIMISD